MIAVGILAAMRPLIGITSDSRDNTAASGKYESAVAYARAVADAGGLPVMLPQEVELAAEYVARLNGFVFSGGHDLDVRRFGHALHPQSKLLDPRRQAFETALLDALREARPQTPCLGVCLGMQLMAIHAGGTLNQFLPDTLGEERAAAHQQNRRHGVVLRDEFTLLRGGEGTVVSYHRQAIADPGPLRVLATSPEGVIEAVDDPSRPFYLGVQWHPERNDEPASAPLNQRLFAALVDAARSPR